jgi:hypothetical protein
MWGTNDAKTKYWDEKMYQRDYRSLLERYKALPTHPAIFIMVSPPLYMRMALKTLMWDMQPTIVNSKLPSVIAKVAQASNSVLVNVFEAMGGARLQRPELFIDKSKPMEPPNDGCHPNDLGYKVLADTVAASFREHFRRDSFRVEEGEEADKEGGRQQQQQAEESQEEESTEGGRQQQQAEESQEEESTEGGQGRYEPAGDASAD